MTDPPPEPVDEVSREFGGVRRRIAGLLQASRFVLTLGLAASLTGLFSIFQILVQQPEMHRAAQCKSAEAVLVADHLNSGLNRPMSVMVLRDAAARLDRCLRE